jgi:hypothetical protein
VNIAKRLIKMTINDEITILANKIANQGSKPTVALIKTKLKKQVPLPVIISTLKTWKHEPELISFSDKKQGGNEAKNINLSIDKNNVENELSDELANMKKEIFELKTLVQQLIKKIQ